MALYLGSNEKVKIISNNVKYILNIGTVVKPIKEGYLLSFDDYILKDLNGLYLIAKEDE